MAESSGKFAALAASLAHTLRRPESWLTWLMVLLLSLLTATQETALSLGSLNIAPWHWLSIGIIAQLALFYGAIRRPPSTATRQSRALRREMNPAQIRNQDSREQFQEALNYHENLLDFVASARASGSLQAALDSTLEDFRSWLHYMHDLALKIDHFEANDLVRDDLLRIPGQLREVDDQLAAEEDETLRADLAARRERLLIQQDNLQQTERTARRARITLQNTRVSLATIYAQITRLGTMKSIDGAHASRLREDIRDEVQKLGDVLHTMDELNQLDHPASAAAR